MENTVIEEFEKEVIEFREKLKKFQKYFKENSTTRSKANYNHLGTLSCNVEVLSGHLDYLMLDLEEK